MLGLRKARIGVGDHKVCERYFPVVPNSYLSCDALLGCDVLSQATLVWGGPRRAIIWGDTPYVVYHIHRRKNTVSRVQSCPVELESPHQKFSQISLKASIQLDPYQTQFVPVVVPETPESTLLVYPQPRFCHSSHPFIVNVTSEQSIYVPLVNPTKNHMTFKRGTIGASYEEVKVPPSSSVNATRRCIHNDLLPQNYSTSEKGTRVQRLRELIKQQSWGHLTSSERAELETLILDNDPLFILSEKELGLISGPLEHIRVSDPHPCRGPRYPYPEQAKQIITDMLKDMEERGIIEPSTAAWPSPIVLVNKPDGGKRVCLDYRQVNKHLATDIYPLPRLEELVDQAAGHQYYVPLDIREAYF